MNLIQKMYPESREPLKKENVKIIGITRDTKYILNKIKKIILDGGYDEPFSFDSVIYHLLCYYFEGDIFGEIKHIKEDRKLIIKKLKEEFKNANWGG